MSKRTSSHLFCNLTVTVCILVTALIQIGVVHAGANWQAFRWGDVNGTVLSDGVLTIASNPFLMDDAHFSDYLKRLHRNASPFFSPMNVVVLDVHGKRIMIDTGSFVPRKQRAGSLKHCGALPESMHEANIDYDSIDAIMLTHGHPDHVMGLLDSNGEPAFPNAVVYISAIEHQYFWSDGSESSGNRLQQILSETYTKYVGPYKKSNRLVLVDDGESPIPKLTFRLAPGHTPGHSIIEVSVLNRPPLVACGDAWALQPLQGEYPDIGFAFEVDKQQAAQTRKTLYQLISTHGYLVLSYHEIFPGLGYFNTNDANSGARWIVAPIDELQTDITAHCD